MTLRARMLHVFALSFLFYCLCESLFSLDTAERPFLAMPKHREEKKEKKEKKKQELEV